MKKIIIFVSSLFMLAACTNTPVVQQPGQPVSGTPSSDTQTTVTAEQTPVVSVADQTAYDSAVSLEDKTFCDKITMADLKKACLIKIEALEKARIEKAQAEQTMKEQYDTYSGLINGDKTEDCAKTLQDANMIANCEATILVNRAVAAKDAGICDQIKDEDNKSQCRQVVGTQP